MTASIPDSPPQRQKPQFLGMFGQPFAELRRRANLDREAGQHVRPGGLDRTSCQADTKRRTTWRSGHDVETAIPPVDQLSSPTAVRGQFRTDDGRPVENTGQVLRQFCLFRGKACANEGRQHRLRQRNDDGFRDEWRRLLVGGRTRSWRHRRSQIHRAAAGRGRERGRNRRPRQHSPATTPQTRVEQ